MKDFGSISATVRTPNGEHITADVNSTVETNLHNLLSDGDKTAILAAIENVREAWFAMSRDIENVEKTVWRIPQDGNNPAAKNFLFGKIAELEGVVRKDMDAIDKLQKEFGEYRGVSYPESIDY